MARSSLRGCTLEGSELITPPCGSNLCAPRLASRRIGLRIGQLNWLCTKPWSCFHISLHSGRRTRRSARRTAGCAAPRYLAAQFSALIRHSRPRNWSPWTCCRSPSSTRAAGRRSSPLGAAAAAQIRGTRHKTGTFTQKRTFTRRLQIRLSPPRPRHTRDQTRFLEAEREKCFNNVFTFS